MGKLRKIGKKIGRGIKKIGKRLKKGLGSIAKAFGKLGFVGSLALSFLLPGIGSAIGGWLQGVAGAGGFGSGIAKSALKIAEGISKAGNFVKNGVGKVFNRVTDAIEYGMNAVSKPFMQEGARGAGSAFRDWASNATGGFIDRSNVGLEVDGVKVTDMTRAQINDLRDSGKLEVLQNDAQFARETAKFDARKDLLPNVDTIQYAPDGTTEIGVEYTRQPTFDPGSKPTEVTFNKDTLMPNPAPDGINLSLIHI